MGKARRTFNDLSIEESQKYTNIKKSILSAYGMVPEADQVKFRQLPLVNDILCMETIYYICLIFQLMGARCLW